MAVRRRQPRWPLCAVLLAAGVLFVCIAVADGADAVAGSAGGSGGERVTRLLVQVQPNGRASRPVERTLIDCSDADRRSAVCRRLRQLSRMVFKPVPRDAVCTQVYGGPAVAVVRGRLRGRRIAATLMRTDGCQIARWDRVRWLLRGTRAGARR